MNKHEARICVAQWLRNNAQAIYDDDLYASHVTADEKMLALRSRLDYADEVEEGLHDNNFTVAQHMYYLMTGESVPLLP